jgi:hypothetical protein
MVTAALARSLRAVGRREESIKWYRRAVESSGIDPDLLSEFLCLVTEEQGAIGLLQELPAYEKARLRPDVRLGATLTCFSAWGFLAAGKEKEAFENMVAATPYLQLAGWQSALGGEGGLACGVLLQIVAETLGDSKRSAGYTEFLKGFPAERVKALRKVFTLSEQE